eukprot:2852499-Rhodomonas_salina.2
MRGRTSNAVIVPFPPGSSTVYLSTGHRIACLRHRGSGLSPYRLSVPDIAKRACRLQYWTSHMPVPDIA